jgi:hypothetical protein
MENLSRWKGEISARTSSGIFESLLVFWFIVTQVLQGNKIQRFPFAIWTNLKLLHIEDRISIWGGWSLHLVAREMICPVL